MVAKQNEELLASLRQLAAEVKRKVENDLGRKETEREYELYFQWKVDKFQYTDEGVTTVSAQGEHKARKSWGPALMRLDEPIKGSKEYSYAQDLLTKTFGGEVNSSHLLQSFVREQIQRLYESKPGDGDEEVLVNKLLKNLRKEPLKYGAQVELVGIVLKPERLDFKTGNLAIVLRQTKVEDLEKEIPMYGFGPRLFGDQPSAILSIDFLGSHVNEIQTNVRQSIALLRLFKVGSVKLISYRMHSESMINLMASGTVGIDRGQSEQALEKYLVTQEDVPRLKKFWEEMIGTLPQNFYELGQVKPDYLSIAYSRYCDALTQNGLLERRIANSVMGLESLFLKGGETQELAYRLGIRLAKVFGLLGHDPHKVKDWVTDAYGTRSMFVHGRQLSYNEKRKLERTYGDLKSFLLLLLDYLRTSILIAMFAKKDKDEFIDLIDGSLIDSKMESRLRGSLDAVRQYCYTGTTAA